MARMRLTLTILAAALLSWPALSQDQAPGDGQRAAQESGQKAEPTPSPADYEPIGGVAQKKGDALKGRMMALELCSACHNVGKTGDSPLPDAPPFRTFKQMWPLEHLEEALGEGIMVGHPLHTMPVFQFSESEIADLIAYLDEVGLPPEDETGPASSQDADDAMKREMEKETKPKDEQKTDDKKTGEKDTDEEE